LRRGRLKCFPTQDFHHAPAVSHFLPFAVFFTIGCPIAGIICLILQFTLIGWIPAAMWAVYALSQYKTDEKIRNALGKR
jgi:conserved domain protein